MITSPAPILRLFGVSFVDSEPGVDVEVVEPGVVTYSVNLCSLPSGPIFTVSFLITPGCTTVSIILPPVIVVSIVLPT
ncbi:unknown [Clostridium sp. CAG:813]|nr:unknown [Clostridium sp. CAG:813]